MSVKLGLHTPAVYIIGLRPSAAEPRNEELGWGNDCILELLTSLKGELWLKKIINRRFYCIQKKLHCPIQAVVQAPCSMLETGAC